jgi:hypothetical protein
MPLIPKYGMIQEMNPNNREGNSMPDKYEL